jgi:hypothetical protein
VLNYFEKQDRDVTVWTLMGGTVDRLFYVYAKATTPVSSGLQVWMEILFSVQNRSLDMRYTVNNMHDIVPNWV